MRHYEACTTILDTVDTCPDVWKWEKTFLDYKFDLGPSMGVDTAMFVKIINLPLHLYQVSHSLV